MDKVFAPVVETVHGQFLRYGFAFWPLRTKKAIPFGMTFSFLVAEAGLEPTTSGL